MSDPGPRSRRLLIVEDERIVAMDLRIQLQELGYSISGVATTSDDALRAAREQQPDLILMDIRLAGNADGIDTARAVREHYGIPIIFLTANTDSRTIAQALETGPGGYLSKPYSARTLLATIELVLRRHEEELARQLEYRTDKAKLVQEFAELEERAERFRQESTTDSLTGLHNRRHLETVMKRELSLAQREARRIGVILLDLDRFKTFNDTFGHLAADRVLREVSDLLRRRLRAYDVPCRYGGEEIVIIAPGTSTRDAAALAEQIRHSIEQLSIVHEGIRLAPVTASFGVASFPEHGEDLEALLQAADAALYASKASGRNRVSMPPAHTRGI